MGTLTYYGAAAGRFVTDTLSRRSKFHYACVNLTAAPEDTDWFCDDDCRANAGVRVRKGPRKKKKIN